MIGTIIVIAIYAAAALSFLKGETHLGVTCLICGKLFLQDLRDATVKDRVKQMLKTLEDKKDKE